jgi:tight adherence protein C
MLLVLATISLASAVFLVAETATAPARRRRKLLSRAAKYGSRHSPDVVVREREITRSTGLFAPLAAVIAAPVVRLVPRTSRETVGRRLLAAGIAHRISPDQLLAAKAVLAGLGAVLGFAAGSKASAAIAILLGIGFGLAGFFLPEMFVSGRINDRRERIVAALPDALDLVGVSVEAGLSFEGALAKLVQYMDGPLIEELALTLNEMRVGESRTEALKRLASRLEIEELDTFVSAVVQAEQLGTSMAAMLRVQADDARKRRQFAAEEKAMKAPIKMLLPTTVFIFPALFIVTLGPVLMNFGKNL